MTWGSRTKQNLERIILNTTYRPTEYHQIEPGDRPDFVFNPRHGGAGFGVEITEVYSSESNARLTNIDGYFQELLAGKPHRHRDDVDELVVDTVEIHDKDGKFKSRVTAVIMEGTGRPTMPTLIAERIASKTAKAATYRPGLTHTNLVILDRTNNTVERPGVGDVYETPLFISPAVREALSASPFGEVHLVSRDTKGNNVVRGLRALTMLEAGYTFTEAVKQSVGLPFECADEDIHQVFIVACKSQGMPLDYVIDRGQAQVQYGGVYVRFNDDGVIVLDGHLIPPFAPTVPPVITLQASLVELLVDTYTTLTKTGVFKCAYGSEPMKTFAESREELGIEAAVRPGPPHT